MITIIYFVRHAEPDYSVHDDEIRPLTQNGEIAAQKVACFFEDKGIEVVLSSPYKRAVDTIKPYANKSGLQIELVYEFRERKVDSCWIEDFKSFTQKQWADFDYKLSDGESLGEVQYRNITALKRTLDEYSGKNIIIGSHGTALSTIINHYDPTFGYDDFEKIKTVMPWIVKFTFEDNALNLIEKIDIFR
jgi:2,3-bisphosphoglycerate-dependent phosphoglycerate mutase